MYTFKWVHVPAIYLLVIWVMMQAVGVYFQATAMASVSFAAHLGGAGMGLAVWAWARPKQDLNDERKESMYSKRSKRRNRET